MDGKGREAERSFSSFGKEIIMSNRKLIALQGRTAADTKANGSLFAKARAVQAALLRAGIKPTGTGKVKLNAESKYSGIEVRFSTGGHAAKITYSLLTKEYYLWVGGKAAASSKSGREIVRSLSARKAVKATRRGSARAVAGRQGLGLLGRTGLSMTAARVISPEKKELMATLKRRGFESVRTVPGSKIVTAECFGLVYKINATTGTYDEYLRNGTYVRKGHL